MPANRSQAAGGRCTWKPSPSPSTLRRRVPADLPEDAREQLEKYIEEEEGAFNRLGGWIGTAITAFAVFVSLFHLYAAYEIVPAHVLRPAHVGMVLVLCFLLFPMARRFRDRIRWWDYLLAAAERRHHPLRALAGRLLRRPRHHADHHRLRRGRRLRRAAARGHAARHRLDHAGRGHRLPPLRHVRQPPAAARGRIAATRSRTSSPTST